MKKEKKKKDRMRKKEEVRTVVSIFQKRKMHLKRIQILQQSQYFCESHRVSEKDR